jgi:hypothetical protein
LIETTNAPVLLANLIAFLTAFGISQFTGQSKGGRFFLVSSSAFAANTLLLAFLTRAEWLQPAVAAVLAAAVIPYLYREPAMGFQGCLAVCERGAERPLTGSAP